MNTDRDSLLSVFIRGQKFFPQPFRGPIVYISVMRRGAKFSSAVLFTAAMLIGMFEATASPPVHRFLAYYEAVEKTNAPLHFWERVAASLLLTQAEQVRPANPSATCSRTSSL